MKLAKKALVFTLTMLALVGMVSAQKSEDDPRNTAPTVGTGGPVGGATGLFTVYDGSTLQKGEFTFSAAYSNYDRDPGDVDISEVPVSFQVGLTNNFEVFFNTDAYRGIKVNSPRNLSGFYLPNSNGGVSYPAIVIGPGSGSIAGTTLFRPTGNQPYVAYPYVGGSAGNYGFTLGSSQYISAFGSSLALLSSTTGGAVNNFPGIGSVYGGILPGIVLQTTTMPKNNTSTLGNGNIEVPTVFTLAPSYLNDAPLLNREWGTSSFSTYTVGAKWRFTSNDSPIGFGVIPFYRFYNDSADTAAGFNQLQRGASPGGDTGDFGAILFADARLAKWVNVSGNVGYVYNSKIKGSQGTLLDRGDELLTAFGVDFPVNKYFQPILEFRSQQFVGGRTYNAFENNPIDAIAGVRIFPARWLGFGLAYRYHANAQDRDSFDNSNFTGTVTVATGTNLATNQVTNSFTGVPQGFRTSSDPHGFILQTFIGRRNLRGAGERPNNPAVVKSVNLSSKELTLPCPAGQKSERECNDDMTVNVSTDASDIDNDPLTYNYTVSAGRIVGSGSNVTWDLSGVGAGEYTITAGVDDGCGVCGDVKTETVKVVECEGCTAVCDCASISVVDPPVAVKSGETLTFTANVSGGSGDEPTYTWSVDKGSIVSGQGTSTIVVSTTGLEDTTVTATVDVGGQCKTRDSTASGSGLVQGTPDASMINEFGKLPNDEVRAQVDQLFIELQNNPGAMGYIVNTGSSKEVAAREKLIKNHVSMRGYDGDRLVFVNGGRASTINTRFWLVPVGADPSVVN
ncbi:MAG: hypothetical protein ACK5NT_01730 [Pyrinomonadaceae bacterium]